MTDAIWTSAEDYRDRALGAETESGEGDPELHRREQPGQQPGPDSPWLVVIDMQQAFGDPSSRWAADGFTTITPVVEQLIDTFAGRVVFTRFVRDVAEPGQWAAYYDSWAEFRIAPDDGDWALLLPSGDAPVIDEPTFSKWGTALQAVVGDAALVLCGVATECCVLATAFAAADAGRRVDVVADACAGASRALHEQALTILHANTPLITVLTAAEVGSRHGRNTTTG